MNTVNLELKRGDTGVYDLVFKNAAGLPLNLAGATVRFTAKLRRSDADASAKLRLDSAGLGGIVITNAGAGEARMTIAAAATAGLSGASLHYDVQVSEPSGVVTTVLEGNIFVSSDITQTF